MCSHLKKTSIQQLDNSAKQLERWDFTSVISHTQFDKLYLNEFLDITWPVGFLLVGMTAGSDCSKLLLKTAIGWQWRKGRSNCEVC